MKTFDEILKERHSVRSYDRRPIDTEHIHAMGEAARAAPSACNSQTSRFVAVTRRDLLDRICDEAMIPPVKNPWLRDAPLVFAGCSKLDLVANRAGRAVTGIEYYQIDLGIAMEHIALKATELGIGTCWIGWFSERAVRRILGVPRGVRVKALLAAGYSHESSRPPRVRRPLEETLFADQWGEPFPS